MPVLAVATYGAYITWYDIYLAMWDDKASTVVFAGIVFTSMVLDWWLRWIEYRYEKKLDN